MNGIAGGLLGLIQIIGGLCLFFLIGRKAWEKNPYAEVLRTVFGGLVTGLLVVIGLNRFAQTELSGGNVFLCLGGGLILAFALFGVHRFTAE